MLSLTIPDTPKPRTNLIGHMVVGYAVIADEFTFAILTRHDPKLICQFATPVTFAHSLPP